MFRKLLLVLLVVVGLAVIAFAVLLVITPAAPIPEQPSSKPAVERRKGALQADAEGQYVPGYHFVVGPLRFMGFSLRPEALVTFAQTGSGAEQHRSGQEPPRKLEGRDQVVLPAARR